MSSLVNTADILRDRFIEEQKYIQSYIELLERKTSPDSIGIESVIEKLEKYKLGNGDEILNPKSKIRLVRTQTIHFNHLRLNKDDLKLQQAFYLYRYDANQLPLINANLQQLIPDIEKAIEEAKAGLDSLSRPRDSVSTHVGSLVRECEAYLTSVLSHDSSPEFVESIGNQLKEHLRKSELYQDAPIFIGDDFGSYEELADHSIKAAIYSIQEEKVSELYNISHSIKDLDIIVRMFKSEAEINILRQGFITLTTIFDATIFDLIREALKRDFFNLIALFGKQEKVSLVDKISKHSSFDEFRDATTEEQLKSKYLKEILSILNGNKVALTDTTQGDEFIHLLEMVLRRNIHIHNRGIVDSKYLEMNESGVPRSNVYNLAAGSVAHIDPAYWERANRLSLNCIRLITDWVNSLPQN
jgi:hypothetical protein